MTYAVHWSNGRKSTTHQSKGAATRFANDMLMHIRESDIHSNVGYIVVPVTPDGQIEKEITWPNGLRVKY